MKTLTISNGRIWTDLFERIADPFSRGLSRASAPAAKKAASTRTAGTIFRFLCTYAHAIGAFPH